MFDLDALQAAAEAATPGPWEADCFEDWSTQPQSAVFAGGLPLTSDNQSGHVFEQSDATFIAAANPAVVLELIERAREADDLSSRLSIFLDEVTGSRLSYSTYPVKTMVRETDARYERLYAGELAEAEEGYEAGEMTAEEAIESVLKRPELYGLCRVEERDSALARIARVEALHQRIGASWPHNGGVYVCQADGGIWPCSTVRALAEGEPDAALRTD